MVQKNITADICPVVESLKGAVADAQAPGLQLGGWQVAGIVSSRPTRERKRYSGPRVGGGSGATPALYPRGKLPLWVLPGPTRSG